MMRSAFSKGKAPFEGWETSIVGHGFLKSLLCCAFFWTRPRGRSLSSLRLLWRLLLLAIVILVCLCTHDGTYEPRSVSLMRFLHESLAPTNDDAQNGQDSNPNDNLPFQIFPPHPFTHLVGTPLKVTSGCIQVLLVKWEWVRGRDDCIFSDYLLCLSDHQSFHLDSSPCQCYPALCLRHHPLAAERRSFDQKDAFHRPRHHLH
jgi:hypothetical protein